MGQLTLHNIALSSATIANVQFNSESCVLRASNIHTELTVPFLNAPAGTPAALYQAHSSFIDGLNRAALAATSIRIAQARALEIRNSFFGGNVIVTSPATVFVSGLVTFATGKGFTGTGSVSRWLSATDIVSTERSGANSPHTITNCLGWGTSVTTNMLNGEVSAG